MNKTRQDKKLLFRIKKKDRDAFLEAYDLYVDDIYRFVYFKTGNEDDARDLTSEVFLKVWNYAQSKGLDGSKSLRAFIYKTARNSVIDYYRKLKEGRVDIGEENENSFPDEKQNLEEDMAIADDIALIKENLTKLKDEYREVILMRFVDELSFSEIADITGKTIGNIRVLTFRALQALRELIEEKDIK
jgi:RNA polymerase sigma-70 factor (ECF subfamily)